MWSGILMSLIRVPFAYSQHTQKIEKKQEAEKKYPPQQKYKLKIYVNSKFALKGKEDSFADDTKYHWPRQQKYATAAMVNQCGGNAINSMGNQSMNYVGAQYGVAAMVNDNDHNQDTYQLFGDQDKLYVNYAGIGNDNQVSFFSSFFLIFYIGGHFCRCSLSGTFCTTFHPV